MTTAPVAPGITAATGATAEPEPIPRQSRANPIAGASGGNGGKMVANPEVETVLPPTGQLLDLFAKIGQVKEAGQVATKAPKGWRLEKRGNYWRFRWQVKDRWGQPVTYKTKAGKTGYKRGSQYVGKRQPKNTK